jgi:hypothetical protein
MKKETLITLLVQYYEAVDALLSASEHSHAELYDKAMAIRYAINLELFRTQKRNRKPRFSYQFLKQELGDNKKICQLAYENKVSHRTLRRYLKRYGLKTKPIE